MYMFLVLWLKTFLLVRTEDMMTFTCTVVQYTLVVAILILFEKRIRQPQSELPLMVSVLV